MQKDPGFIDPEGINPELWFKKNLLAAEGVRKNPAVELAFLEEKVPPLMITSILVNKFELGFSAFMS